MMEWAGQVYRGVQSVLDAFPAIGLAGRSFRVRRTRWGADPLFRGSYSYCPADGRAADMDTLAAPVVPEPNADPGGEGRAAAPGGALPRVMFAGEATHRSYFGTVHGAFFSVRTHVVLLYFEVHQFFLISSFAITSRIQSRFLWDDVTSPVQRSMLPSPCHWVMKWYAAQ